MNTKISVIIPVYNTEKYLAECLDSVLAQTFTNWDAICVNDGSVDNSAVILEKYAEKDSRIKVINQKNAGVVSARNNGIAAADGEYIFFLDDDDKIAPDCFEKLLPWARKNTVAAPRVMRFGEKSGEMLLPKITKYNMAHENCLCNAALFPKELITKFGGFDSQFNRALEDYDLWCNFIYHGVKFKRVTNAWFYYRMKPAEESRNLRNSQLSSELCEKLYRKYPTMRMYKILGKIARSIFLTDIQHNHRRIRILRISIRLWRIKRPKIENPKLIMTLLVKNEADIIEQNLQFHWAMGVDGFIATDNLSDDGTRDILQKYKDKGWILEIIDEAEQNNNQANWVHRMIELAKNKYHADWVINCDADEFWYEKSGNLKNEIHPSKKNSRANKIFVPIYAMKDDGGDWSLNNRKITTILPMTQMQYLIDDGKLSRFSQFMRQVPKIILRTSDYRMITKGNHNADMVINVEAQTHSVVIYHFNFRGREQFKRKIIQLGASYARQAVQNPEHGVHVKYLYAGYKDGTINLDVEYDKVVGNYIEDEIKEHNVCIVDNTIKDFVE